MKNLEDIPKKNVFEAPEGYFDRLPGIIQARVTQEPYSMRYRVMYSLKYALSALTIVLIAFFYWSKPPGQSAEDLLASVDSVSLVSYLEDSDISSDDLLESI